MASAPSKRKKVKKTRIEIIWEENYRDYEAFCKEHGRFPKGATRLAEWVQRQRKNKDKLGREQIARLDELNFDWTSKHEKLDQQWKKMFRLLCQYQMENGHTRVPKKTSFKGHPLGSWVSSQYKSKRDNKMRPDRELKLKSIGFAWTRDERRLWKGTRPLGKLDDMWNGRLEVLVRYKKKYGDTLVKEGTMAASLEDDKVEFDLGKFVCQQRLLYRDGLLRREREEKLRAIGFEFSRMWNVSFEKLAAYKDRHGTCNVPAGKGLGVWLQRQRSLYRQGTLAQTRLERLNSLGCTWKPLDEQWNIMLDALKQYKAQFGDCRVPCRYTNECQADLPQNLAEWAFDQQQKLPKKAMAGHSKSIERKHRLDDIGFCWINDWDSRSSTTPRAEHIWWMSFSFLQRHKQRHGRVVLEELPSEWISEWARKQIKRKDELTETQRDALDLVGLLSPEDDDDDDDEAVEVVVLGQDQVKSNQERSITALGYEADQVESKSPDLNKPIQSRKSLSNSNGDSSQSASLGSSKLSLSTLSNTTNACGLEWCKMCIKLRKYMRRRGTVIGDEVPAESLVQWVDAQLDNKGTLSSYQIEALKDAGLAFPEEEMDQAVISAQTQVKSEVENSIFDGINGQKLVKGEQVQSVPNRSLMVEQSVANRALMVDKAQNSSQQCRKRTCTGSDASLSDSSESSLSSQRSHGIAREPLWWDNFVQLQTISSKHRPLTGTVFELLVEVTDPSLITWARKQLKRKNELSAMKKKALTSIGLFSSDVVVKFDGSKRARKRFKRTREEGEESTIKLVEGDDQKHL